MNWTAHEDIPKGTWVKKVEGLRCQCFARCQAGDMIFAVAVDDFAKGDRAELVELKGSRRKEMVKLEKAKEPALVNPIGIIVNARVKAVQNEMLSYEELVQLAFDKLPQHQHFSPTVQYSRAAGEKSRGVLLPGESVKVQSGTIFDVVFTDSA
jgi:hypothetical protein